MINKYNIGDTIQFTGEIRGIIKCEDDILYVVNIDNKDIYVSQDKVSGVKGKYLWGDRSE